MTPRPPVLPNQGRTTNLDGNFCCKLASRWQILRRCKGAPKRAFAPIPQSSPERLEASLTDTPLDIENVAQLDTASQEKQKTVLYLAYGSNLCDETFLGRRGIRPLSSVNVMVPSLRLTFDLPGIPYAEPCFANTALRLPDAVHEEKRDYHKNRWHKGLVGIVYEVTLSDYAHIIATEGGGSSYKDILVDCHVLPDEDIVPTEPSSFPFKAHTLFAPQRARPDPAYAQASARYLKLITDGAEERGLPAEYKKYLAGLRPYTITTKRQTAGKLIFMGLWGPLIMLFMDISKRLQDDHGRVPKWYGRISTLFFSFMWLCYDYFFFKLFGDGERTNGQSVLQQDRKRGIIGNGSIQAGEKIGLLEDTDEHVYDAMTGQEKTSSGKSWCIV